MSRNRIKSKTVDSKNIGGLRLCPEIGSRVKRRCQNFYTSVNFIVLLTKCIYVCTLTFMHPKWYNGLLVKYLKRKQKIVTPMRLCGRSGRFVSFIPR